jgi:branched-chain amino acid transport system ATP-binding protein
LWNRIWEEKLKVLRVDAIDLSYGDLQALWGVSLSVEQDEIVALIGANGAGKSSLLRAIMGLHKFRKGTVEFNGVVLNNVPTHTIVEAGIYMVPEGRGLFPGMSVLENLEMGAFIHRARSEKVRTAARIFDMFPVLGRRKSQMAGSLSGGEQQMLAIAKGLMSRPTLLLIDEMSSGLSPLMVKQMLQVVKRVRDEGVSILIVEQNVYMALNLADRGYVIENGRIVSQGNSASLLKNGHIKAAYLGIT